MYYVKVGGRRWKVRQAISLKAALDCIAHARVTGSVGGKDTVTEARAIMEQEDCGHVG
jgi:hypothetical protein